MQTQAQADDLVRSGNATVLVEARVERAAAAPRHFTRKVTISEFTVVAGRLSNGPVRNVEEASARGENTLPPGDYLLLLGAGSAPSVYFLSDSYRGSFRVDGNEAYQQCSVGGAPALHPVRRGITDRARLATLFTRVWGIARR